MKIILCFFFSCLAFTSHSQTCKNLPNTFKTYKDAITKVQAATFQVEESANTSSSSWITSARYYICDGKVGYFIYTTNRGYNYIHKGVPMLIWRGFKAADSKGSYYNIFIKGRYLLNL